MGWRRAFIVEDATTQHSLTIRLDGRGNDGGGGRRERIEGLSCRGGGREGGRGEVGDEVSGRLREGERGEGEVRGGRGVD